MARSQARSRRKYTGKKYKIFCKKRKKDLERPSLDAQIGAEKNKKQKILGGNFKVKLFSSSYVNVADLNNKKTQKVKILRFDSNVASKDLNRRHVLTKGAIVETEMGKVKITSRPGQHGILNGVLIQ